MRFENQSSVVGMAGAGKLLTAMQSNGVGAPVAGGEWKKGNQATQDFDSLLFALDIKILQGKGKKSIEFAGWDGSHLRQGKSATGEGVAELGGEFGHLHHGTRC